MAWEKFLRHRQQRQLLNDIGNKKQDNIVSKLKTSLDSSHFSNFYLNASKSQLSDELLHKHQYRYSMNALNVCSSVDGKQILYVTYVHSTPSHTEERNRIRRTWGAIKRLKNYRLPLVFVLGQVNGLSSAALFEGGKPCPWRPDSGKFHRQLSKSYIQKMFSDYIGFYSIVTTPNLYSKSMKTYWSIRVTW